MGAVETGHTPRATLLPDPEPRPVRVPVISVDDHLIEPPDLFEGRLPGRPGQEGAPRVVEEADGSQAWIFEGHRYPNVGLNAVVGRPREEWSMDPARFDEMRPGCFDIDARIDDMDRAGLWASLCFPSLVSGLLRGRLLAGTGPASSAWPACGRSTTGTSRCGRPTDPSASSRCSCPGSPTSTSPRRRCGPTRPAASRRSASPSSPAQLRLPVDLQRRTGTPSSPPARRPTPSSACTPVRRAGHRSPRSTRPSRSCPTFFPVNALLAAGEWLWSGVPLRFPTLEHRHCPRAASAGCTMLMDRADYVIGHSASGTESQSWPTDLLPSEVLAA